MPEPSRPHPPAAVTIRLTVNGTAHEAAVEPRRLLSDVLRDELELTGVRVSCEQGVCGACTIHMGGRTVRACLTLAVQAHGEDIRTVEALDAGGALHPLQQAFWDHHGLQCGFCTPGMLMTALELLTHTPAPTDAQIRNAIAGNICRCTGYVNIVKAIRAAADAMAQATPR